MSTFLKWYLLKLKTYPMYTNLSTALVLMTVGDVMAQELEHHHLGDSFAGKNGHSDDNDEVHPLLKRRISLRRYGTQESKNSNSQQQQQQQQQKQSNDDTSTIGSTSLVLDHTAKEINLRLSFREMYATIEDELTFLDPFRITTMVAWNVGVITPAYMGFYRYCDNLFLGRPTPFTVAARVLMTLAFSVPVNAMFFTYGTCAHHTAAWVDRCDETTRMDRTNLNLQQIAAIKDELPPFDWETMWSTAYRKMEAELPMTMQNSAIMWIPINLVSFAVVPSHLRPLLLMTCSVFWNCYLSIVQHRDVVFVASSAPPTSISYVAEGKTVLATSTVTSKKSN